MMLNDAVEISEAEIEQICREYGIARLLLFGSVLRRDFGPESDVDVLVEFQPGHTPGLGFIRLQTELAELFGRRVDLVTPKGIHPRLREDILTQAEGFYAAS